MDDNIQKNRCEQVLFKLSAEEKDKLLKEQEKSNYPSLASYIRYKIFSNEEPSIESLLGVGSFDHICDDLVERNKIVNLALSEEEYRILKRNARFEPLSDYIRRVVLDGANGWFHFDVRTYDISDIAAQLEDFNIRTYGVIQLMENRSELFREDATQIRLMVKELNCAIQEICRQTILDREIIKNQGIRYLQNQIRRLLERLDTSE